MTLAVMVSSSPAAGPKAKVPSRMGISAGSYSRNEAAGMSGKWTMATRTTEIAARMPSFAMVLVFVLTFSIDSSLKR